LVREKTAPYINTFIVRRFAGFKETERDKVAKHFSSCFNLEMLDKELSVKGWNWGAANFNGSVLQFEVGKHDAFEVPLNYVSHCSSAKNEVCNLHGPHFSSL
jgi:structure-specific recognition protein 1